MLCIYTIHHANLYITRRIFIWEDLWAAVAAAEVEPAVAVAEAAVHIPWVEAEAEPAVRLDPDIPAATHFVDPAGVIAVSHPAVIQ